VVAIDPSAQAVGLQHADDSIVCDLKDFEQCLRAAKAHAVRGVLTIAAEYPVPTMARLCHELGLPGLTPDVARVATNKREMRRCLVQAQVPCPQSLHVTTLEEARTAVRDLGCSTIFKPALSQGKHGITRVPQDARGQEVEFAFQRAMRNTRADAVLVEEFVEGPEFSVEALTWNGQTHVIAVTDKVTTGPPYYVEIGHSQPSQFDVKQLQVIEQTAAAAVQALGIDWSGSHTEIRWGARGPRVIEVGARLGGGFIASHLVPISTGVDMVGGAISLALGEPPATESTYRRGAAIRFLTPSPGIVSRIDAVDACRRMPGVRDVQIDIQTGQEIRPLIDNSCRVGHVICDADDTPAAIRRADLAAAVIRIELCPGPLDETLGTPCSILTR
jgi:biotin carboxylase